MSMRQRWQVGQDRFTTREDAEDHARTEGEMFVARYQNKPGGPVRRLLPVRGTLYCAHSFLSSTFYPIEGLSGRLPLRPSNEHILIVRVPGARESL
jgi:hypothetical protein